MKELLDSNNKELVAEIESIVPIYFIQHKESCYQATVKKDLKGEPTLAKLWYYEPLSQAKLAHELYHIKIAVLLGDNASMIILPEENMYASIFYNKEYCTDFLNHIEHLIFYNIYKDAGYSDNDFFEYVNPEKAAIHYQNIISNGIKNEKGLYNIYRLQEYIRLLVLSLYIFSYR